MNPGTEVLEHNKQLQRNISDMGPWFHNLHLPDGAQTAPNHHLGDFPTFKWQQLAPFLPEDLTGWTALDIGCNAGFYTFELAKRGARTVGIDLDDHYLDQARWAAKQYGLEDQVEFREMQIYDLAAQSEVFDLVLFMGVFYHLRYPLLGLDIVAEKVRRLMVFQTLMIPGDELIESHSDYALHDRKDLNEPGWPKTAFIEHQFSGDPTNWWVPNRAGVEAMLRSSGLKITGRPEPETYLCEPDPDNPSSVSAWNRAEYLSATGQPWK